MAYDKEEFDRINAMPVGDLVHFMLVKFEKSPDPADEADCAAYMQSLEYFWAYTRLNEIFADRAAQ